MLFFGGAEDVVNVFNFQKLPKRGFVPSRNKAVIASKVFKNLWKLKI